MKQDILALWIDALESDEFTQTKVMLKEKRPNGTVCHCAEGVLCELYERITGDIISNLLERDGYWSYQCDKCDHPVSSSLPPSVREWAGINTRAEHRLTAPESATHHVTEMEVWMLNDDGMTFAEIAQLMREQWLDYTPTMGTVTNTSHLDHGDDKR